MLTVNDPELIKLILVKDFNVFQNRRSFKTSHEILDKTLLYARSEKWKRLRTLSTSVFTGAKIKGITHLLIRCVEEVSKVIDRCALNGTDVDLKHLCGSFSMDVIARCAFATRIDAYEDPNNTFLQNVKRITRPTFLKIAAVLLLPKYLIQLLKINSMFDETANQFVFNLSRELLNRRRNDNQFHNDLLQLLIETEVDENGSVVRGDDRRADGQSNSLSPLSTLCLSLISSDPKSWQRKTRLKAKLSDTEIIAQSWLFLLAGYETTSTSLAFCLYELALNQEVQQRLYEELQTVVDSSGDLCYDQLWKLAYLEAVINESLRLYPAFMRVEREAKHDYWLGDTGVLIKARQLVQVSIYAVHHNAEFFAEPELFLPSRFMPDNKHNIIPYSFLPFAVGPRNCVAMRLALMEMKVCVARLIRSFRLETNERTLRRPKFLRTTHLCVSEPLLISVIKR